MTDVLASLQNQDIHQADGQPGANVKGIVVRPALRPKLAAVDNADANTTGVKTSYVVPTSKGAIAIGYSMVLNTGTPTVRLQVVRSGGSPTVDLAVLTASEKPTSISVALEAGDTIQFNVTVAGGASSTVDLTISVQEVL